MVRVEITLLEPNSGVVFITAYLELTYFDLTCGIYTPDIAKVIAAEFDDRVGTAVELKSSRVSPLHYFVFATSSLCANVKSFAVVIGSLDNRIIASGV